MQAMATTLPLRSFTPTGWQTLRWSIDATGTLLKATPAHAADAPWALPGIPNTHSHAFQRAMAGLAECQTDPQDSFWTWRERMYHFASRLDPESLYDIAAQLYVEMLEAGYTSVCEFHYLHHQPDGRPYADQAAMSRALIAAAADTGIRMTLLPVLYMCAGFDGRELEARQRRFGNSLDSFYSLIQSLRHAQNPRLRLGIALHSLRAVPPDAMRTLLDAIAHERFPIHIHIAEQLAEVEQCLASRGARPVQWLLDNAEPGPRWTLVHATHLDTHEINGIASRAAHVSLCPSTEANLGDGLFPLRAFLDAGGRFSIGSDSHISVSPVEELRWLEYSQRLSTRRRNIASQADSPGTAQVLLQQIWASGAESCGAAIGRLETGAQADFITLDNNAAILAAARDDDVLDRFIFSGNRPLIDQVHVAGQRLVAEGRHRKREIIAQRYHRTLKRLLHS